MNPAKFDITIYQGATYIRRFTWNEGKTPRDIVDHTFKMQIRPSLDSDVVLGEFSSINNDFVIEDAANGKFALEIPHTITADMDFTKGVYDIEVTTPEGRVFRLMEGMVELSREVTR